MTKPRTIHRTIHRIHPNNKLVERFDEAKRLYEDGWSTKMLGRRFKMDPSNVYRQFARLGVSLRSQSHAINLAIERGRLIVRSGSDHPSWKGGRTEHAQGYILLKMPEHHRASSNGYVLEHIVVAEKIVGRRLRRGEIVHHVNGIKTDNRPNNLVIMTRSEHIKSHWIKNRNVWLKNLANARDIQREGIALQNV